MKYEAKTIPEGINTSDENPLKEFFLLVGGVLLIILCIVTISLFASDYLVKYIPIEAEQRWFSSVTVADALPDDTHITSTNKDMIESYLQQLTDDLQDEAHSEYSFNVRLTNDDKPNAFITPGGNIFVTKGLLKIISSENALSMVLGHEMGHQYHRHPLRSAGRGIVLILAFIALSGFDGDEITQSFIGNGATIANLTFSREQEREADDEGVRLLIDQYGHAQGASEFFRQIEKLEQARSNSPVFLRTHPGTKERISFLGDYEKKIAGKTIPLPDFVTDYANQ